MSNNNTLSAEKRTLSLLIPGLFGPNLGGNEGLQELPPLLDLEKFLARATRTKLQDHSYDALICTLFNVPHDEARDLPIAAITRVYESGNTDPSWWMRADPVYLQADRDILRLVDSKVLRIDQQQADALVEEVMAVFAEDGWKLTAVTPEHWYLTLGTVPKLKTTELNQVIGRNIEHFLPGGEDGKAWQAILNEVQILLHTATANSEREQHGELPVNSLWFWGSGVLPKIGRSPWVEIWGNEPTVLALARLSVTPTSALPVSFEVWQQRAVTPGDHLVILDQGRAAVNYQDVQDWSEFIQGLEMNWLEGAMKAIQDGSLQQLCVYNDNGYKFCFNKKSSWKWWRRRKQFVFYCNKFGSDSIKHEQQ